MRTCLLSAALIVLGSAAALAQSAAGLAGISGVVRDASNASVANAKVVVSNQSKGIVRTLATNAAGVFTAAALPPASGYTVTVTALGVRQLESEGCRAAGRPEPRFERRPPGSLIHYAGPGHLRSAHHR